jgi:hypothetical protein
MPPLFPGGYPQIVALHFTASGIARTLMAEMHT